MKVELRIRDESVDVWLKPEDEAERRILWFVGEKKGVYVATTSFEGHPTNGKAKNLLLHFIKNTVRKPEDQDNAQPSMHGRSLEP